MSAVHVKSINLFDVNMEILAEIMVMHDPANNVQYVKFIPFYGMFKLYEHDPINVVANSIMPGMVMQPESFLSYIGNCANQGSKMPYAYTMASNDVQLVLTTGLSLQKIADLTGWELEMITDFYKDYVVFG